MSQQEKNAYILGTENEELFRLGLQHQVWAEEAQKGWNLANFNEGQTILDLGCGPGFCTKELAFITGQTGKVIGVDKSRHYIEYLREVAKLHHLNVEAINADFNEMNLKEETLDGMYCRWALAWLPNPKKILEKVLKALKPGGKMVIHEYYDWSVHQINPPKPNLSKAIAAALKSFKESEGQIDIGREIPLILEEMGMEVLNIRPLIKLVTPKNTAQNWLISFYKVYFPKLVQLGYLTQKELTGTLKEIKTLKKEPNTTLLGPLMVEIIAQKQKK